MRRQFCFYFGLCAVLALVCSTAKGDLTAYWSFDSDYSSSVNNGTMQGVSQGNVSISNVAGEYQVGGGALKIDSPTSGAHNVHIPNPIADTTADPTITIVAWFNYTDIGNDGSDTQNYIWESNPTYSVSFGLENNGGAPDGKWYYLRTSGSISDASGPVVAPGEWHHVVKVWNPESNRSSITTMANSAIVVKSQTTIC